MSGETMIVCGAAYLLCGIAVWIWATYRVHTTVGYTALDELVAALAFALFWPIILIDVLVP